MMWMWLKSLWRDNARLRRCLLMIDGGLFGFWAYSVAYIFYHPADKGSDGFEIFLVLPMTAIAVFLNLPALLLLISNGTLRAGAWVTQAAIVSNVLIGKAVLWNSGLGHGNHYPLW